MISRFLIYTFYPQNSTPSQPTALSTIPDAIKECKSLLTLDLSCNPLGDLCPGLLELRQLRKLQLNDIQLEEIPSNIGRLELLVFAPAIVNLVSF